MDFCLPRARPQLRVSSSCSRSELGICLLRRTCLQPAFDIKGGQGQASLAAMTDVVGEAEKEGTGLDISEIFVTWDATQELRDRLRGGQTFMHPSTDLKCDNRTCTMNGPILEPLLLRMSMNSERKLPIVQDLREQMTSVYQKNKRVDNPEDEKTIVGDSWHIRKLLSHVKAKARRGEVSNDTWLNCALYCITCIQQCSRSIEPRIRIFKTFAFAWHRSSRTV